MNTYVMLPIGCGTNESCNGELTMTDQTKEMIEQMKTQIKHGIVEDKLEQTDWFQMLCGEKWDDEKAERSDALYILQKQTIDWVKDIYNSDHKKVDELVDYFYVVLTKGYNTKKGIKVKRQRRTPFG
jgi:hypothetical protein